MERVIINNTLKLQYPKIQRIKKAVGYGERYAVNSKYDIIFNFFSTICLWVDSTVKETDGSVTKVFELPIDTTLDGSPLLQFVMKKYNVEIEE